MEHPPRSCLARRALRRAGPRSAFALGALALAGLAAALACSGPDEHARGRALYRTQGCATCHGDAGQGVAATAPPLRELQQHWDRASLAEYLRNPRLAIEGDPRLGALRERFTIEMPAIAVREDERLALADFVLTLR